VKEGELVSDNCVCPRCNGEFVLTETVIYEIDKAGYGYTNNPVNSESELSCKTCNYKPSFGIDVNGKVTLEVNNDEEDRVVNSE